MKKTISNALIKVGYFSAKVMSNAHSPIFLYEEKKPNNLKQVLNRISNSHEKRSK